MSFFFTQLSGVSRPNIYASFARAVILALGVYWYPKALMSGRDETYCTLPHLSVRSSQGGMIPFVLKNIISPARVVSILPAWRVPLLVCLPYTALVTSLWFGLSGNLMSAEKRGPKKRRSNNTSLLFEATGAVSSSKLQGRRDPK